MFYKTARYKLESLKMSMRLFDKTAPDGKIRSDSEMIDLLITRCVLQEYYPEERKLLDAYHNWLDDQGLVEWVYD
ncbi:hypothetical protein AB3N59_05600 [Leptospira sp. WS92.C1]